MCAKGAILGAKIRSYISSTPSSKLFIFTSLLGLDEDTKRDWFAMKKMGTPIELLALRVLAESLLA